MPHPVCELHRFLQRGRRKKPGLCIYIYIYYMYKYNFIHGLVHVKYKIGTAPGR